MTKQPSARNGRVTEQGFAGTRARHTTPSPFQEGCQSESPDALLAARPEQATVPMTGDKPSRLDWQVVALWGFVAVSFAAFVFAGYLIWAKCRGISPF